MAALVRRARPPADRGRGPGLAGGRPAERRTRWLVGRPVRVLPLQDGGLARAQRGRGPRPAARPRRPVAADGPASLRGGAAPAPVDSRGAPPRTPRPALRRDRGHGLGRRPPPTP